MVISMSTAEIGDVFYSVYALAMELAGPILLVSMAVGIIISILQAATQINEQTMTFVPKLLAISMMLVLLGNRILVMLQDFLLSILDMIATG